MNVPDTVISSAIGGLALYIGYLNKRMADSYFEHVESQSVTLKVMEAAQRMHEEDSVESHRQQCDALNEMTKSLRIMNNGHGGK